MEDEPVDSLWRIAVHECAHALAWVMHGGTVISLEARPWRVTPGEKGHCLSEPNAAIRAKGWDAHYAHGALASLAGRAAERTFFGTVDAAGCSQDLKQFASDVREVDAAWHTGAPVEVWEQAIGEMARQVIASHEPVIAYVARVLADERKLGERRAMELFGIARKLWGIQPGPLSDPRWRERLKAAVERHWLTMTLAGVPEVKGKAGSVIEHKAVFPDEHAAAEHQGEVKAIFDRIEALARQHEQHELQAMCTRMTVLHGVQL